MEPEGPTVEDLIEQALGAGHAVTHRQIERWHKAGLLPRRHQFHLAGLRGSVSRYPAGIERQFVALCRLVLEQHRPLREAGFWLWWDGYNVPPGKVRLALQRLLRPSHEMRELAAEYRRPFDAAEAAAERMAAHGGRSRALGVLRRNLKADEQDVQTALLDICQMAFGSQPIWTGDGLEEEHGEQSPQEIVFQALGLDRAASDKVGDVGPWLTGGAEMVPRVFALPREGGLRNWLAFPELIAGVHDEELELAREDAHFLAEDLPAMATLIKAQHGKAAFGFEMLRPAAEGDAWTRALAVALCVVFRRAGLGSGIDELKTGTQEVVATARVFVSFARTFPQYRRYLPVMARGQTEEIPEEVTAALRAVLESSPQS